MGRKDITQLEIKRLPEIFNLTDGHAHRDLLGDERAILETLSERFILAKREQQQDFEGQYLRAFYKLVGQTIDHQAMKYMLLPAASFSLEIVANYLRMRGLKLALIEPCFDNLVNIFKRHDIELEPFPDQLLESDDGLEDFLQTLESDAICLVSPNNPTGIAYTEKNFKKIVDFCRDNQKLLVIDSSFRPYRPLEDAFDEYAIAKQSDIECIFIEDSGKTWPTRELKVSILAVSSNIFQPIFDIYTDMIYHHSPFTIGLVTEFIKHSIGDGLQTVRGIIQTNRSALRNAVEGSFLELAGKPYASVAWLRINHSLTARMVHDLLAKKGVFVLEGSHFYWTDPQKGDRLIRVALVRDPDIFTAATERVKAVLATID